MQCMLVPIDTIMMPVSAGRSGHVSYTGLITV